MGLSAFAKVAVALLATNIFSRTVWLELELVYDLAVLLIKAAVPVVQFLDYLLCFSL
jgi:hypothetical protein